MYTDFHGWEDTWIKNEYEQRVKNMDVCIGDCLNYFFVDQNIEKIGGKERKEN